MGIPGVTKTSQFSIDASVRFASVGDLSSSSKAACFLCKSLGSSNRVLRWITQEKMSQTSVTYSLIALQSLRPE